jgi:hypothetical protein
MPSISIAIFGSAIGARSGSVIHVDLLLQAIVQGKHGESARVIEPIKPFNLYRRAMVRDECRTCRERVVMVG